MKKITHFAALAAILLVSSLTASDTFANQSASQPTNEALETIIVTATRTPILASEAFESISVFTRQDIERLQVGDLFSLLSRAPGVSFIRNGGRGSATSLSIRGNQGDHALFLIDGVRIGSATLGSATLSALSMSLVERVEIIRGPKSALYGADAIGGVVNIITRKTKEGKSLSIETSYGSNETKETTVVAGVASERFGLNVVLNSFDTQGIDDTESKVGVNGDDDAFRNNSLALNLRAQLADALNIKVSYNYNEGENEYDTNCGDATTFAPVDCLIYSERQVDSLSALIEFNPSGLYQTSLQLGQSHDESMELADNLDLSSTYNAGEFNTTKTEATSLNTFIFSKKNLLMVGFDYQLDEVGGSTNYSEDSRYNKAAFAQLQAGSGVVNTIIGVRYDDNEQFGDVVTLSGLLGVDISENLRAYMSYGEGFKPPTFNDLYFPNFGNPTFEPEESENYEIGIKGQFAQWDFSTAVFNNDIKNLIQYNSATFSSDQTAKADINGFEFSVNTSIANVQFGFNGSMIDPENSATGLVLRRRAKRAISLDVDRQWAQFGVGASLKAESKRFNDAANTNKLAGYSTVDIRAFFALNDQWRIEARIDNVTDKQYSTAVDFSLGKYQSVGRETYLSVRFTPTL